MTSCAIASEKRNAMTARTAAMFSISGKSSLAHDYARQIAKLVSDKVGLR